MRTFCNWSGLLIALCLLGEAGCYSGFDAVDGDGGGGGGEGGGTSGVDGEDGASEDGGEQGEGDESSGQIDRGFMPIDGGAMPPEISDPGDQVVEEDALLQVSVAVSDADGDPVRVWATGLPPGARWDERARMLEFRPDFIQGGKVWDVTITADDGGHRRSLTFNIEVSDTIAPPMPEVVDTVVFDDYTRLELAQVTDEYLDSPGYAGREFVAYVTVPHDATEDEPMPVRVNLHGFGSPPAMSGSYREFRIGPHDPSNTYWWGYDAALPEGEATGEHVPDYTLRRTLHLVEWVLENYPEADAGRVFAGGSSMGGAGALTLGLMHARHFAYLSAVLGQAIPKNHRPTRLTQLAKLYGPTDSPVWDLLDLTRALGELPEATEQYVFVRHGKDDPTIHFGAAVLPSPLTGDSLYDALQGLGVGHMAVWDEGGHGPADPVMGSGWWDDGFSPMHDDTTFLRRDLAFPAFALSSADGDPGDGTGNGKRAWSANKGYAGDYTVAGDTGWTGDIAGAFNRFLRWDAAQLVDTLDRFAVPLHVHDGDGSDPPKAGYPSKRDRFDGELPVVVDVTPRRTQAFRAYPGERVEWRYGEQRGEVQAGEDGSIRVEGLELDFEWRTLELVRRTKHEGLVAK